MLNCLSKPKKIIFISIMFLTLVLVGAGGKGLFFGVRQSNGNYRWTKVASKTDWSPDYAFSVINFDGKIWALGKKDGNWVSDDGVIWQKLELKGNVPQGHNAYFVFKNEIYAVGGTTDWTSLGTKGVWKTADGVHWQMISDNPAWSARMWHQCVVFADKIWLVGGYDGTEKNDVWASTDGIGWERITDNAAWDARSMHVSLSFNGKLWIMGGRRNMTDWWETDFNDVWYSENGNDWKRATSSAGWSKRFGHAGIVWNGEIWLMGGSRMFQSNDVWHSPDGVDWTRFDNADWSPRFGLAAAVFQDKVWVLGGKEGGGQFNNDIWHFGSF